MSGVILEQRTGVRLQHVPYRGAPPAILAVMGGEVTMGFFNTPTVLGQIKAGKLKALAVTSKDRSAAARRADHDRGGRGGLRGHHVVGLRGAGGHAEAVVARLNAELNRVGLIPQVKEKLLVQGFGAAARLA